MALGERCLKLRAAGALLVLMAAAALSSRMVPPVAAQGVAEAEVAFQAVLNGAQAVPPTLTGDAGEARLVLDQARGEIHYRIDVAGVRGRPTAFWIQLGAPGQEGENLLVLPPASAAEGVWRPDASVLEALKQERLCVVIPTDLHPAGEVRGDLRQLSLATDKATWGRLKAIFNGG